MKKIIMSVSMLIAINTFGQENLDYLYNTTCERSEKSELDLLSDSINMEMQLSYAKALIRTYVCHVVVDCEHSQENMFDEAEEHMRLAYNILRQTGMTDGELEYALGCNGYDEAIKFTNK
tara:strand:- start:59 stop:418 length:360 start_codon:yes stop_codon:yes gene_type:complete